MQKTQFGAGGKRVREEEDEFAVCNRPFACLLEKRTNESKGEGGFEMDFSHDCCLNGVTAMAKLKVSFARTEMSQIQLYKEYGITKRDYHGCIRLDIILWERRGPCLGTFPLFGGGPDKYMILARAVDQFFLGDQVKYNKFLNIFQDEADRAKDFQSCLTEELRDALNSSVPQCCVCLDRTVRHTVCKHTLCIHCQLGVEKAHQSEPTFPCPICRGALVKTTPIIVLDA